MCPASLFFLSATGEHTKALPYLSHADSRFTMCPMNGDPFQQYTRTNLNELVQGAWGEATKEDEGE